MRNPVCLLLFLTATLCSAQWRAPVWTLDSNDTRVDGASMSATYDGTPDQMILANLHHHGQLIDFTFSASPSSITISPGQTASFTVTATAIGGVWPEPISLTCSGMPVASTCSFTPSKVDPRDGPASCSLRVVTTPRHRSKGTPAGTYTVKVVGLVTGFNEHSIAVSLTVK